MSSLKDGEIVLRGIPISKGIGIGSPVFFVSTEDEVQEVSIAQKEIDLEIDRYRRALDLSRKDVEMLKELSRKEGPPEIESILGAHLEMMRDPLLTSVMEDKIRDMQKNTESIFLSLIEEYKQRFSSIQDLYFQERVRDIVDVSRRILGHLRPLDRTKISEIQGNSIILTHELVPSETVEANASLIRAFVTAAGGITSHAAIIARAKGIPYVANVDIKNLKKIEVQSLIVDGSQGLVILNPTRQTLRKYQQLQRKHEINYKKLKSISHLKGETIDGLDIEILGNLEHPKELNQLIKAGAGGVGLFRSEYLFLSGRAFPSEEEQFQIYKKMVKALKGKPLVIRIFDVGGDKTIDLPKDHSDSHYFHSIGPEMNPALGCRAIRFLLRYPNLLEQQLAAIVRASQFGPIQILIPMVSDVGELRVVRQKVESIQAQIKNKKQMPKIQIGCMIEVPSSAIMCDALSEEADFLSIGTNDLAQYVLAADRSNPHTSPLYFSPHPSILRLIRTVVVAANKAKKPVILCGEAAADPVMVPLLMGLGVRGLSVAARHIPGVKHTIRKWRILEACALAENALQYASAQELKEFLASSTAR
jgi:phosphotransferase system enzyme I (PtsI)